MIHEDLTVLAGPQGRLPGTPGHRAAAEYLIGRFADLGLSAYPGLDGFEHRFDAGAGVEGRNLIGVVPGRDSAAPPILIGAHYDSVIAAPSADDNAAAVAVLLAVAQGIGPGELERDLIVASFDTEEPPRFLTGHMGSARFVADVLRGPVHVAVIMDLVGHPFSLGSVPVDPDLIFALGAESHPALPAVLTGLDMPVVPTRNDRIGDMSDHAAFREAGWPYLFFSCGQWPAYHTQRDTVDGVDPAKLQRLAVALDLVLRQADRTALGPAQDHDTTALEVQALHDRLGPEAMALAAAAIGQQVGTRDHLDQLVPLLQAMAYGGGAG